MRDSAPPIEQRAGRRRAFHARQLHRLIGGAAKILRLATNDIDTLDPQQWQDRYSQEIGSSIFESLYERDYLARPPGIVPNVENAFVQPWVSGYYRSPFATYYKYVDIDLAKKQQAGAR